MSQITTIQTSLSMGTVASLTGDGGGAVGPDGASNIDILGGNNITTTGNPGANSITIDVTGTTDHGVQVGNATGSLTSLAVGTDGQVLLGATGADPAFATLTSTGGTISFTAGANTLNLESVDTMRSITSVASGASPYTVLSSDDYISCDVSAAILSLEFPDAPATGTAYTIKDATGNASTFNITITTVGGVVTFDGNTSVAMNTDYEAMNIIFNGTSYEIY